MARRLTNWLDSHLQYVASSESPDSYHLWAGIGSIASALQRKCYLDWGFTRLYPNQYIVLVGPSGRVRKGDPIQLGLRYADALQIKTVAEKITHEAFIHDLAGAIETFQGPQGQHIEMTCMTAWLEELAVFTKQQQDEFLATLTALYDSRDQFRYRLKHQDPDELKNVCFSLIGACAFDWLPIILSVGAVGGGFTSRVVFIVEDKKSKVVTNPNRHQPPQALWQALVADLDHIKTNLRGAFHHDTAALATYESWYAASETMQASGILPPHLRDPAMSSYLGRRASHLHKLCMALSASRRDDLCIDSGVMNDAISILEKAESKMARVYRGFGRSKVVAELDIVRDYLRAKPTCNRAELLSALHRDLDDSSLDRVVATLRQMQVLKVLNSPGGETVYQYVGPDINAASPPAPPAIGTAKP